MTEVIFGFIGVLVGAGITHYTQMRTTQLALEGEHKRIIAEAALHDKQIRLDKIRECVADIIIIVEPEMHEAIDKRRLLSNIHKVQMLLDTAKDEAQADLNGAINVLAGSVLSGQIKELDTLILTGKMVDAVKKMNK